MPKNKSNKGRTTQGVVQRQRARSMAIARARAVSNRAEGLTVVQGQEQMRSLNQAVTFTNQAKISLNPGLFSELWLGRQARCWDRYRFRRLRFHYQPAVPTTTPGVVYMSFDPNAGDIQDNQNGSDFLQCEVSKRLSVFTDGMLEVPGRYLAGTRYLRESSTTSGDVRLFDVGTFRAATEGGTVTNLAGYFTLEYIVEFSGRRNAHEINVPRTQVAGFASNFTGTTSTSPEAGGDEMALTAEGNTGECPVYLDNNSIKTTETGRWIITCRDVNVSAVSGNSSDFLCGVYVYIYRADGSAWSEYRWCDTNILFAGWRVMTQEYDLQPGERLQVVARFARKSGSSAVAASAFCHVNAERVN